MNTIKDLLIGTISFVFIGGLLYLLYAIVRYSIISPLLTRGSLNRIRKPDFNGIEELVGFIPDSSLLNFYIHWPHLEKTEYYLVNPIDSVDWFIGGFMPISKVDIKEWLKVSGDHGLPIADDMNLGTYFVRKDNSIELRSPNISGGRQLVANSIEELMGFRIAEPDELYPEEDA